MANHLVDAVAVFAHVAFPESPVEIVVKTPECEGAFAALIHVQGIIEFADDFLRALKVVMNHHVRLGGIIVGKARQGAFQCADRAIVEHQYDLSRRSGEGGDLSVRFPGIGGMHGGTA